MTYNDVWLENAQCIKSPNHDDRPCDIETSLLVIHNISLPPGQFKRLWIADFFCNQLDPDAHPYFREIAHLRVSAHLLIRRDGTLIQFVPLNKRAWHAGNSSFEGRAICNDYSIGIELEGTDDQPYSDAQYRALLTTTATIMQRYPSITPERIVGHCDIAPQRKTDPGAAFDWPRYRQSITHD